MAVRKPFNLNLLVLDDGQQINAEPGLGMQLVGQEQIRQRRAVDEAQRRETNPFPSFGGSFSLPNPMWDGYFGLLQGKENAAQQQGRGFRFDVDSWGNDKALDVPTGRTYFSGAGEVAPGLRGRPGNPAIAALQGAVPSKNGYYTQDEVEQASGHDALNESRRRAFQALKGRY